MLGNGLGKGLEIFMRNSSIYRSNLSDEKVAFLSEIKSQKDFSTQDDNTPKAYKRPSRQKELDLLWQNFKINPVKEEKSPGVYLLTGFIAGALCMFVMNAILSIGTNVSDEINPTALGQPKFEKKIERHPEDPIMLAVKGMLPKGPLGRKLLSNLKVFAGAEHTHTAQNPQSLEV